MYQHETRLWASSETFFVCCKVMEKIFFCGCGSSYGPCLWVLKLRDFPVWISFCYWHSDIVSLGKITPRSCTYQPLKKSCLLLIYSKKDEKSFFLSYSNLPDTSFPWYFYRSKTCARNVVISFITSSVLCITFHIVSFSFFFWVQWAVCYVVWG